MGDFTHLLDNHQGTMVGVGAKQVTEREASVAGQVSLSRECCDKLTPEDISEITTTARIAGVMAAKRTAELIPYCHPLLLTKVDVECQLDGPCFRILSRAKTTGRTGVEMEAFVAAQITAMTIYDMIKAVNPEATVGPFELVKKTGGKAGKWTRPL